MTEANLARDYWSRTHAQSACVIRRGGDQDYRYLVAERVLSHSPRSVLEFGCSSGRNLSIIRSLDTGVLKEVPNLSAKVQRREFIELTGVDVNPASIRNATDANPSSSIRYILGDERELSRFPDNRFDVVFTVSVLDHIPDPQWKQVYDQLVRVAAKVVVLLEPVGDMASSESACEDAGVPAPPFSYFHSYMKHDARLRLLQTVVLPPAKPEWADFGEAYCLMERRLV